jgi:predicted GIY-YIG superfamily endonuclease
MKEHSAKSSRGAKYMKYFDSFELVYQEEHPTLVEAMRRETQIKGWTKVKKEALVEGNLEG